MKLEDIKAGVIQILSEESRYPTVRYIPAAPDQSEHETTRQVLGASLLTLNRSQHAGILSDAVQFRLQSTNYNLVVKLFNRVDDSDRPAFLDWTAERIASFPGSIRNAAASFPSWNSQTSDLPLVADLIRNGGKPRLFKMLASTVTPGAGILLLHIEDIIALNYPVFSDSEHGELSAVLGSLRKAALTLQTTAQADRLAGSRWTRQGFNARAIASQIHTRCNDLIELCRKARYFYLRDSLADDVNLEINQDKYRVEGFLREVSVQQTPAQCLE